MPRATVLTVPVLSHSICRHRRRISFANAWKPRKLLFVAGPVACASAPTGITRLRKWIERSMNFAGFDRTSFDWKCMTVPLDAPEQPPNWSPDLFSDSSHVAAPDRGL